MVESIEAFEEKIFDFISNIFSKISLTSNECPEMFSCYLMPSRMSTTIGSSVSQC